MRRIFGLLGSLLLLCAAAPPELPEPLNPYMTEETFDPGDYGWMRGAFPDASAAQKVEYDAVVVWLDQCSNDEKKKVRAELAKRGLPDVKLEGLPITTPFCHQFAVKGRIEFFESFDDFGATLASTQPIYDAFLAATDLASQRAQRPGQDLAADLHLRTVPEQVVRKAFSWTSKASKEPRIPMLTADQKPVFAMLNLAEMSRLDRANTAWLKDIIAKHGWPTYSLVGEDASRMAWLLAQHADHDPVFQLDVLRLIEPLTKAGEVNQSDYAYLYDRVMLKLVGTQRYATQLTCKDGEHIARPLEDAAKVPQLRKEMGMVTFEEYLARFSTPCPAQ